MQELWQLYDEQSRPLEGQGANKDEVFGKALLHGASHVWIWRQNPQHGVEALLQKRAGRMRNWPNRYDVSAAGHISLGEAPLAAALRETHEETGLAVADADLKPAGTHRAHMTTTNGTVENEYQWLYLLEFPQGSALHMQQAEVAALTWKSLADFKRDLHENPEAYVPHGDRYYNTVITAIQDAARQ